MVPKKWNPFLKAVTTFPVKSVFWVSKQILSIQHHLDRWLESFFSESFLRWIYILSSRWPYGEWNIHSFFVPRAKISFDQILHHSKAKKKFDPSGRLLKPFIIVLHFFLFSTINTHHPTTIVTRIFHKCVLESAYNSSIY